MKLRRAWITLHTAGARWAGRPGALCPSGRLATRPGRAPCPASVGEQPRALADDHGADEQGHLVDQLGVEKHDLTPGGEVTYFLTGPEGDQSWGAWRVTAIDPPNSLEFTADACTDADGTPVEDMPVHNVSVELREHDGGTRMVMRLRFESRDDMEKLIEMGTPESIQLAIGQTEALLR